MHVSFKSFWANFCKWENCFSNTLEFGVLFPGQLQLDFETSKFDWNYFFGPNIYRVPKIISPPSLITSLKTTKLIVDIYKTTTNEIWIFLSYMTYIFWKKYFGFNIYTSNESFFVKISNEMRLRNLNSSWLYIISF